MSDAYLNDPYAAPGRGQRGRLTDVSPEGYDIEFDENGQAFARGWNEPNNDVFNRPQQHFENLAELMDLTDLDDICSDLLEAIEEDKDTRSMRDQQYEQGLNRTGMGNNVIGGANFPGASRAVHPILLESSLDFGGAMMNEMLPPGGPCKAHVVGDETEQKDERGKRVARWLNYLFTEVMTGAYHEFEIGFTQCPLGGGFYTKTYIDDVGNPAISFIPIDHVYRPYSDGDFYSQPRITHAQSVDRWTYRRNVDSKLWLDVVDYDTQGGNVPERTKSDRANDRTIGKTEPTRNLDGLREVYECSCTISLNDDEAPKPYLVTIDKEAREVLAIYRNWREQDETEQRCVFLIEWPFWPWRGGYPVGLTHMIGSLAGAATGSLRALLDAAMLNTTQTGMRLKGGSTQGGQNMTPRVTEINEVQGSLSQDDIRKTFMPIQFNPPNETLLKLLSFLVDAGRGVVRSTYDDMDKFGAQTPVGTTQMFLEQGLRNLGAVHGRMHRAMRLLLKGLYQICQDTLQDITVLDALGELTVSRQDFQGPMPVIPVSDPRLWSDMQRKALAQTLVTRASDPVASQYYQGRATEVYFLKQMGVDNPDQFLKPNPQPSRMNAVTENVAASQGQPLKAFAGQDHEAHIQVHLAYMQSEFFAQNASLGMKFLPIMIDHLGEHLAMWYNDAMLEAATEALRSQTGNNQLTLQSFMGNGTEVGIDRLMAALTPEVLEQAQQSLADVPEAIEEARQMIKQLQPPMPMDPSLVAQEDVQRQREADKQDHDEKIIDLATKRKALDQKAANDERNAQLKAQDVELKARKLQLDAEKQGSEIVGGEADRAADVAMSDADRDADILRNREDNETAIELQRMQDAASLQTAKISAAAAKARGAAQARAKGTRRSGQNVSTGVGGDR